MSDWNAAPVIRDGFVLFWGTYLSNFYPCKFVIDGIEYNRSEQYFMAEKARHFQDEAALVRIMASNDPYEQKALGRTVKNFSEAKWLKVAFGIMQTGVLAKFRQNEDIKAKLLGTGELIIVEASPSDKIWGIGRRVSDPYATVPEKWLGTNWLGNVHMLVRSTLRDEAAQS